MPSGFQKDQGDGVNALSCTIFYNTSHHAKACRTILTPDHLLSPVTNRSLGALYLVQNNCVQYVNELEDDEKDLIR